MSSENDPWLIFPDGMLKRSEIKHVHFIDHTSEADEKLFGEKFYTLQCGIIAIKFPAWAEDYARSCYRFVRRWLVSGEDNCLINGLSRGRYGANDAYKVPEGYRLLGDHEVIKESDFMSGDRTIVPIRHPHYGPVGRTPWVMRLERGKYISSGPWFFRKVSND